MLTHDEILNIAKAEGYYLAEYDTPDGVVVYVLADGCINDLLEKVAAAAAAKEREAWLTRISTAMRACDNKDNQE